MNTRKIWDEQLIGMLQYLFITVGKHDLRKVAQKMNLDYHDLYPYVTGKRTMPTELLRGITEATHDKVFLDVAWAGSKLNWEWKEPKTGEHQHDVVLASLNIAERIVNLTQELKKGLLDRTVENGYKKLILNSISEAIGDLQSLFTVVSEGR
jgi:hypothetical protein